MKRKMMKKEPIPNYSTTNGGNGSYMNRQIMQDKKRGGHKKSPNLAEKQTATGKAAIKAL